jgi:general secretion pathway protein G
MLRLRCSCLYRDDMRNGWKRSGSNHSNARTSAFSLVELLIIVIIIGIIAAIAVPRLSSGSERARANTLRMNVTNVRHAIDRYYAEHDRFPGYDPDTGLPKSDMFPKQLLQYSDRRGNVSETKSSVYRFGPYLRPPFPKNPTNNLDTVHVKANPADANPADGSVGWIAVLSTGDFGISAADADIDRVVGDWDGTGNDPKQTVKLRE